MVLFVEKLLFGIEEEFFLFTHDNAPPSHETIDQLYGMLVNAGCEPLSYRSNNTPGSVLFRKGTHSFAIKNEYCTHIMEVAFSPLRQFADFRSLWATALEVLHPVFTELNLKIIPGAVLKNIPNVVVRHNDTDPDGLRLQELLNRSSTGKALFHQQIFATICSTQVNFGIAWNEIQSILPFLYACEFLFPLLFSNGNNFQDFQFHAIRPLLMQENFNAEFREVGFPISLEKGKSTKDNARRSYTYIADRGNRVEFRSADCQGSCEKVIKIVKLRRLILSTATQAETKIPLSISRHRFFQACHGEVDLAEVFDILGDINVPEQLLDFVEILVNETVIQNSSR